MIYKQNLNKEDFYKKEYLLIYEDDLKTTKKIPLESIHNIKRRKTFVYFDAVDTEGEEYTNFCYECINEREAHSYYQKFKRAEKEAKEKANYYKKLEVTI